MEKLIDGAGGYDKVRNDFIENGKTQFGSGWTWLTVKDGALHLVQQDTSENTDTVILSRTEARVLFAKFHDWAVA